MRVVAAFKQMQANGKLAHALGAVHTPWRRSKGTGWLWFLGFAVGLAVAMALLWSALRERPRE